jgi:hypothetical protein
MKTLTVSLLILMLASCAGMGNRYAQLTEEGVTLLGKRDAQVFRCAELKLVRTAAQHKYQFASDRWRARFATGAEANTTYLRTARTEVVRLRAFPVGEFGFMCGNLGADIDAMASYYGKSFRQQRVQVSQAPTVQQIYIPDFQSAISASAGEVTFGQKQKSSDAVLVNTREGLRHCTQTGPLVNCR